MDQNKGNAMTPLFRLAAMMLAGFTAFGAAAQLPAPNTAGVSTGHTHLVVPDVARHRDFWIQLGAQERSSGRLQLLMFPGMHILLREGEPGTPSTATTANHIGFTVNDYALYKQKLAAIGAVIFFDDGQGQVIADLPDGVRLELATDTTQTDSIAFHHTHLFTADAEGLRQWYVEVFDAAPGSRRNLPSALIPGGQVDFFPSETPLLPSAGNAIDHIGFEVADLAAFAARLETLGITFDRGPECIEAIDLCIAFITDPAGTYIELTEGLIRIQ